MLAFKKVVEHVHGLVLAQGRRRHYAKTALEILFFLIKKTAAPLVDAAWIDELLESGARGNMDDDTFAVFLRLSARRNEENTAADAETTPGGDHVHVQGGELDPQSSYLGYPLFIRISQDVHIHSQKEGGWQDDAVYGGLIAMRDIPQLGACLPDDNSLEMLFRAMEDKEGRPFRVRKAAYDVILAARDGWLRSPELHQKLEELDIPRRLHSVVLKTGRSDYQRSFLTMMEILSEDRHWYSYLRESMDIWLPLRHEGPDHVLRILSRVSDIPLPDYDGFNPPLDNFLEKLVEDEWAGVPGRSTTDLTADRLEPLVEVTMQFKELLFTTSGRRAVLAAVDRVIPALERRRDGSYEGPGEDIHRIVGALQDVLRISTSSSSRRSAHW